MQSVQTKKEYYGWINIEVEIGEGNPLSVRDDARRVCQKMNEVVAKLNGLIDVEKIFVLYEYDENRNPVYFHPRVRDYANQCYYKVSANFTKFDDDAIDERQAEYKRVMKVVEMFVPEAADYSFIVYEE